MEGAVGCSDGHTPARASVPPPPWQASAFTSPPQLTQLENGDNDSTCLQVMRGLTGEPHGVLATGPGPL